MARKKYRIKISEIPIVPINHGNGIKKIFVDNGDNDTALTQFAWSKFEPGTSCDLHCHNTMDEYFFVYKGKGVFTINNSNYIIREGDFLRIPAKTEHMVLNNSNEPLEFIYFGIALNDQSL